MISGDLDSTTPPGDARLARERLGRSVRFVSIPNAGHVPSIFDQNDCAQRIVRAFIAAPKRPLDTTCVRGLPEIRAVGVFPLTLADQPPATRLRGDRASSSEARLAALAVAAVGDALQTGRVLGGSNVTCGARICGIGLRGGLIVASNDLGHIAMTDVAFSRDTAVSGSASVAQIPYPAAIGVVTAKVRVRLTTGPIAEDLSVRWDERQPRAMAVIDGTARSGHAIRETVPAP